MIIFFFGFLAHAVIVGFWIVEVPKPIYHAFSFWCCLIFLVLLMVSAIVIEAKK